MTQKLVVCDLDNTLLSLNSFRLWVMYWNVLGLFCPPFLIVWLRAQWRRLFAGSGREDMKAELMRGYERFEDRIPLALKRGFLWILRMSINKRVFSLIGKYRHEGILVLLATAAPGYYATAFGESLKFDGTIASYLEEERMREMVGEEKRSEMLHWLTTRGWKRSDWCIFFLTDHQDDLPLARESDLTYLVNPSAETVQLFEQAGVEFENLNGVSEL